MTLAVALARAGIRRLRLSPQARNFAAIVRCFDEVFNRSEPAAGAAAMLAELCLPGGLVNGYAVGRPGKDWSPVDSTGNGRVAP